ncbi:MAG: N-6 DNA methylase [Candidatus Helarchaeota archaeon]|nr:N-6 DNA methylase [Candidatus Helarchaeota archaeon]
MDEWRKEIGAFFTPPPLARFLVKWAITSQDDIVLDPGAGDGIFLIESLYRFNKLGVVSEKAINQIFGVELDEKSYLYSKKLLSEFSGYECHNILNMNFFDLRPQTSRKYLGITIPLVNAIIGNPPYIRYHRFKGRTREKAQIVSKEMGVTFTNLASSWAPYLVHATSFLKQDGKLAMVVPGELLYVDYAKNVREFLLKHYHSVTIIAFEKKVFPEVLEDTLLLLADKKEGKRGLIIIRLEDGTELEKLNLSNANESIMVNPLKSGDKWSKYLINVEEYNILKNFIKNGFYIPFREFASVDIGFVTGNNKFFILSKNEINEWNIEKKYLKKVIRKSSSLTGLVFSKEDWDYLYNNNEKCCLLYIEKNDNNIKNTNVWKYLENGIEYKVNLGYKTRKRDPWYSVPYVKIPDCFLTYMSNNIPKFCLNEANVSNSNTIHGVFFKDKKNIDFIIPAYYNTLTLLSIELRGRSYGGGVLKLETKEAESILIPNIKNIEIKKQLKIISNEIDLLLRKNEINRVIELIDEIVLVDYFKINNNDIDKLKKAYLSLKNRRLKRMY